MIEHDRTFVKYMKLLEALLTDIYKKQDKSCLQSQASLQGALAALASDKEPI